MPAKISERALIQRINRKLAKNYAILKVSRIGSQLFSEVGRYYIKDYFHNRIVEFDVQLDTIAKELNVIRRGEKLKV